MRTKLLRYRHVAFPVIWLQDRINKLAGAAVSDEPPTSFHASCNSRNKAAAPPLSAVVYPLNNGNLCNSIVCFP